MRLALADGSEAILRLTVTSHPAARLDSQDPPGKFTRGSSTLMGVGCKLLPSPTGFANLPSANELQGYSMEELVFERQAAAEYDRAFSHVTRYFMPLILRTARVAPGMRVLDIAAGTGLSAEAALSLVGPTGHVTAADVSPAMAE